MVSCTVTRMAVEQATGVALVVVVRWVGAAGAASGRLSTAAKVPLRQEMLLQRITAAQTSGSRPRWTSRKSTYLRYVPLEDRIAAPTLLLGWASRAAADFYPATPGAALPASQASAVASPASKVA